MFSDGYIGDTYFDVELLMIPDVVLCRLAKGNKDETPGKFDSHSNLILFPTSFETTHHRCQSRNPIRML